MVASGLHTNTTKQVHLSNTFVIIFHFISHQVLQIKVADNYPNFFELKVYTNVLTLQHIQVLYWIQSACLYCCVMLFTFYCRQNIIITGSTLRT